MTSDHKTIRIGTRGSPLARWQANWVGDQLRAAGCQIELIPISTQGDRQQSGPIGAIGVQGVFTKELQRALLDDRIDLAVHSLKDLPTEEAPGLCLAAVPEREAAGDALVSLNGLRFESLPRGAIVGTGSLRRRTQLLHVRPDLQLEDVRGNVDTRLKKLESGQYAALILAEAGLKRLGLESHITEVMPKSTMLPAVGQGALGLETRESDSATRTAIALLDHLPSHQAVLAERNMLRLLCGGCLAPIGAWGRHIASGELHLSGVVLSRDGQVRIATDIAGDAVEALELGAEAARTLLHQGAAKLIEECRTGAESGQ